MNEALIAKTAASAKRMYGGDIDDWKQEARLTCVILEQSWNPDRGSLNSYLELGLKSRLLSGEDGLRGTAKHIASKHQSSCKTQAGTSMDELASCSEFIESLSEDERMVLSSRLSGKKTRLRKSKYLDILRRLKERAHEFFLSGGDVQ